MKKLGYFILALKLIIMAFFTHRAIVAEGFWETVFYSGLVVFYYFWAKDIYKKFKEIE